MKKKSLLTTILLILGLGVYTTINTSNSFGFPAYQSGCTCHNPSPNAATTVTISGLPTFYNLNTAYPITVTVANSTMNGAGFQIQTNIGSFSSPGSNVSINSPATSAGHNSKKFGSNSVSFNLVWNSPSIGGTAASFNAVGNAARPGGINQAQWNTTSSSNIALPIDLVWINAQQINENILVSFKTATESNVALYEIQRSTDAENFESIATINPIGNKEYQFQDSKLLSASKYFYRIKEISVDNKLSYSNVATVAYQSKNNIELYPTLITNNQLNLKGLDWSKQNRLVFYNALGNIVFSQILNQPIVSITKLPSSVYFAAVFENDKLVKTQQVIVQ